MDAREPFRVEVSGPLAQYASGFRAQLQRWGYAPSALADHVRLMGQLSGYLADRGLDAAGLTPKVAAAFAAARRGEGYRHLTTVKALTPLLGYLRDARVVPEPVVSVPGNAVQALLQEYRGYLVRERGLAQASVRRYASDAQVFLAQLSEPIGGALESLSAGQVTAFVVDESARRSVAGAKLMVTVLRSLLGFLHVTGRVRSGLVEAVPSVAGWKLRWLPRGLPAGHVDSLLSGCRDGTAEGLRANAICTLLSRLGLRACEVAALRLDDIDWRAGELVIRGKANRWERLPLPADVGQAVAEYVRHGRPRCTERAVFVRVRAPLTALTPGGIRHVVHAATRRVGLPHAAVHRLRHSLATDLLRHGAPLSEVGQLLRHRNPLTTAIYAKVDRDALGALARPWPTGGAQ